MNKSVFVRLFIFIGISALFFSCGSKPKIPTYTARIHAPSSIYKSLIIKKLNKDGQLISLDTVKVENNLAVYKYQSPDKDVYFVSNGSKNLLFFKEPAEINIYINPDAFAIDSIKGGTNNHLFYSTYVKTINHLEQLQKETLGNMKNASREKQKILTDSLFKINDSMEKYRKDFVRSNPSLASVVIMTEATFENQADLHVKDWTKIYQDYPDNIKNTDAGKFLTKRLNLLSAGAIGMRMQNFTAPDPEGKLVSLYSVMGKVTLVDFWSSWCKPCRAENPNLVRIYKQYHDAGLNIISVSLDKNKQAWLNAIEKDGLKWFHVSHLKGWNEPVAKQFKITFIPQSFLIDKNGIVRYKNLRGKMLEEKIKELLNE